MSSPNMNNLIIAGSVCAYMAVFLLGIDTRFVSPNMFEKLCYAKTWVLSVGFTLAFGSMFSKTWRVHSIFTNIRRDKKAIKDFKLYIIVATIMLIDAVILFLWATISPFKFSVTEHETIRTHNSLIVPELERCRSDYSIVFQVVFYIFKGMLMLFGCFLAWETRAVNIPALNDSKYIGMSVYIVVVMCIVGLALAFILQERLNEAFALISFFIIFCTTLTLSLVFMPKVIEIMRTPHGTDQQRYRKGMMKSMVGKQSSSDKRPSPRSENVNRQLSITVKMPGGIVELPMVLKAKCGSEIKKLQLYQGQMWDFDKLAKKMQRVFQVSADQLVALKYRDAEGDWITLADDEDLGVAMRNEPSLFVDVIVDLDAEPSRSPVISTIEASYPNQPLLQPEAPLSTPVVYQHQLPQSQCQPPPSQHQLPPSQHQLPQSQCQPPPSQHPPPPSQQQTPQTQTSHYHYQQQAFGMQPLQQELPPSVTGNLPSGNPFSRGQNLGFSRPNSFRS